MRCKYSKYLQKNTATFIDIPSIARSLQGNHKEYQQCGIRELRAYRPRRERGHHRERIGVNPFAVMNGGKNLVLRKRTLVRNENLTPTRPAKPNGEVTLLY